MLTEKILFKESAYLTKYEGDRTIIDKHVEHIGNFWLNVNKGNHYNDEHIHGLVGMSVVYYHKTCCNKTPIYFKHLVPAVVENVVEFSPMDGDIIFFPSHLTHGVRACGNADHERISIAMNFPGNFQE